MSHPSYLQMVKKAIIAYKDKSEAKGISRETIRNYVENNYVGLSTGKRFETAVVKALQQGIDQELWEYGDKRCKGDNTRYKYIESSDEEQSQQSSENSAEDSSEESESEAEPKPRKKKS
eukprot:100846_1